MSKNTESIRTIRDALGITQEELARRVMVSRNYISLLESGAKEPSTRLMNAIQSLLLDAHKVTVTGPTESTVSDTPASSYGQPADRAACETYVRDLFNEAEASGDPNAFPYILRTLRRRLPIEEFTRMGEEVHEAERQRQIDAARPAAREELKRLSGEAPAPEPPRKAAPSKRAG